MQIVHTITISAVALAGYVAAQSGLTANTPGSLFECQPGLLTWTGGVAPYFPRINMAGSTTSTLEQLPQTSSNSYTWTVNLAQGTTFTFAVADSTGAQAYSGISPAIGPGNNSCLNATATSVVGGGSMTTGGSSSTAAGTTPMSSAPSTPTTRVTSSTGGSTTRQPTASAAPSTGNGASKVQGYAAIAAGAVGVVVAALI